MYVKKINLYNYRNFSDFSASFSDKVNFIIGDNAQGKTNLIEAVNLISTTRSFRTSQIKNLIQWDKEEMSVFLSLHTEYSDQDLGYSVSKTGKTAFVNGDKTPAAKFISRLSCVTFTPTDLNLIKGTPELRRKFVDRYVVDIFDGVIVDMLKYNKALKSKNVILKQQNPSKKAVSAWNEIMAATSVNIINGRRRFLKYLEEEANRVSQQFCDIDGIITLELKSDLENHQDEITFDEVYSKIENQIDREILLHTSIMGLHRDDVIIKIGGKEAKSYASQGQTRSIVLSLKLGVLNLLDTHRGDPAILLLDDVDSELDETRSTAFFEYILTSPRQIFITGTDANIIEKCTTKSCQTMRLKNGELSFI